MRQAYNWISLIFVKWIIGRNNIGVLNFASFRENYFLFVSHFVFFPSILAVRSPWMFTLRPTYSLYPNAFQQWSFQFCLFEGDLRICLIFFGDRWHSTSEWRRRTNSTISQNGDFFNSDKQVWGTRGWRLWHESLVCKVSSLNQSYNCCEMCRYHVCGAVVCLLCQSFIECLCFVSQN